MTPSVRKMRRTRIDVLSEIPGLWRLRLRHWKRMNRAKKPMVGGKPVPSLNEEYLLYQTLLGVWPEEPPQNQQWQGLRKRVEQFMIKAMREAKENTSWVNPNKEYEDAVSAFVKALLTAGTAEPLSRRFRSLPTICLPPGHVEQPVADVAQTDRPWRARHLPGQRALGLPAGRSRQPHAGELRSPAAVVGGALRPANRRRS